MKNASRCAVCAVALSALACSSSRAGARDTGDAGPLDDARLFQAASTLTVPVPGEGRTFVALAGPSLVTPMADAAHATDWDLAFEGYDIFTNSGASGQGKGGAFGRLDSATFLADTAPEVPFVSADKTGGAFLDWYAYDASSHALYSRFHIYGLKRGDRLWKLQILSYYGEQDHAAVSARYSLRYAELGGTSSDSQTVQVDGTAGGLGATPDAASGCLDLATGTVLQLTEAEALSSKQWDLCFRRDAISVNGQAGGPRGDAAVDLQASETANEALTAIVNETADGERARFDDATVLAFDGAHFRGDHLVSGFETGRWVDGSGAQSGPARAAWLVNDASGSQQYLVAFSAFEGPTNASPGSVVMRIKQVTQ